jgi:hypothetical protein
MARNKKNQFLKFLSGKIGDIVVRNRKDGSQVVARAPQSKTDWAAVGGQGPNRDKFKDASDYYKKVAADPELYKVYEKLVKGNQNVQNITVRDYFRPPRITNFAVEREPGSNAILVTIDAVDDTLVTEVTVTLYDAYDQVIIAGPATRLDYPDRWEYRTEHPEMNRLHQLEILARDMPGNVDLVTFMAEKTMA